MGNILSTGAYSALGGFMNRYKKRTSSKKKYSKKTKKTKYSKGTKTKSSFGVGNPVTVKRVSEKIAKMPDQRMTRMEYKQGYDQDRVEFPSDGRTLYAGFQNHGGYIPHLRTVAGSIVRDICGKNGVKFPTWNTGATYPEYISTDRKMISSIRFYYRGQNELIQVDEPGTEIAVADGTVGVRTLWQISKDLSDQMYEYARAAMFPYAYEVLVFDDSLNYFTVKFRDDNIAQSSVTVRVKTSILASNFTENLSGGHSKTDNDTVPLKVKRFVFRNSVPILQDNILTAADNTLNFQNIHYISNSNLNRGMLDMQHIYSAAEPNPSGLAGGFYNPFKTCPQGKVVFKNLRTTSSDMLTPGGSMVDNSIFAYSGSLGSYLKATIIKDRLVSGTPHLLGANGLVSTGTGGYSWLAAATITHPQAGEGRLFCFERVRTFAVDGTAFAHPLKIRFAINHQAEAYVQPFKAVPLPKCRVDTNDWDNNPGNALA